jgi:hypothetical protein
VRACYRDVEIEISSMRACYRDIEIEISRYIPLLHPMKQGYACVLSRYRDRDIEYACVLSLALATDEARLCVRAISRWPMRSRLVTASGTSRSSCHLTCRRFRKIVSHDSSVFTPKHRLTHNVLRADARSTCRRFCGHSHQVKCICSMKCIYDI